MHHPPTVFLIDDDTDDQEIFSEAMQKANGAAQCVFANDGIHALEKIREDPDFRPDYIFIDMNMPRMNGQQCLAEIKKFDRLKGVPVYMYSTSVDPESIEENKRLGAIDFIVKPSDINELIDTLRNLIQKPVFTILLFLLYFGFSPHAGIAQDTLEPIKELKRLSVEELMNIVVTSVSKTPENLSKTASAIQVVTGNDIRRSAAMLLPEALRLVSNLQVMQSGSHDWSITSRGFNGSPVSNTSLANKLLVMIDGRTVYTPLFGGVYWDAQSSFLEDVDRIEVVSGPGGTLWGSNAVNGVVNIISKSSKETQGLFASASYGSFLRDHFALRYGGQVDSAFFFRVYGQRFDGENALTADRLDAQDSWSRGAGGFRMDFVPTAAQTFTLQGELYAGKEDDTLSTFINGQHILGRWTNTYSATSNTMVQAYFDRTWRDIRSNPLTDELITFDFEVQQQFAIGERNIILAGAGYRMQDDQTISTPSRFDPAQRTITYLSGFIQDQIALVPDNWSLTIGSKFLHNDYSGFEIQPSVRLAWTPDHIHTLWGAVSRAVRTPTRLDIDYAIIHHEHPQFVSEKVIAYEVGYKMRPLTKLSFSAAAFFNQYTDLRTFNSTGNPASPLYFGNDMDANTWGLEISGTVLVWDWWRMRGGCTFLDKEFTFNADNLFPDTELLEANDPEGQFLLHSIMDIGQSFELDVIARYVDELPGVALTNTPAVPSNLVLSARLGWEYKFISLSISGKNLLEPSAIEVGTQRIPRSIITTIKIKL